MDAEILAIGSELLLGATVDTNSAYLAAELAAHGVNVVRKTVVGDSTAQIAAAVAEALDRADLLVCTGGLGPTVDDVTREGVAQATGRPLEFRQELLDQIAARFAAFQRTMSESNRRQAYVPQGARAIENPRGTAPAFLVEDERGAVIVLPGVPNEMRFLFQHAVLPYLRNERSIRDVILVRTLHAAGVGESIIGERIADLMEASNPAVGISAKQARYELRIAARADSQEAAEELITQTVATMQERLGNILLGEERLDEHIGQLLREQRLMLALYEGHALAPVYHALRSNALALRHLHGVMIHPLNQAADEAAAAALAYAGAERVRHRWRSDLALSLQPVAQPDENGFTAVCLSLVFADGSSSKTLHYDLREPEGWDVIGTLALDMLRQYLLERSAE
jgi:competence/damage-inducible protein CinA-like protein